MSLFWVDLSMKTSTSPATVSRREQQSLQTCAAIIAAARTLFTEKGYHGAGTHEIVAQAKVTRGALAHHFPRKENLFLAVFESVQESLLARVPSPDAALKGKQHWLAFRQMLNRLLDSATDPEVQRILLLDGPAVLGWAHWRENESGFLTIVETALAEAMESGLLRRIPIEALAHLILAAHNEAVMLIAHATHPRRVRADVELALDALLSQLAQS